RIVGIRADSLPRGLQSIAGNRKVLRRGFTDHNGVPCRIQRHVGLKIVVNAAGIGGIEQLDGRIDDQRTSVVISDGLETELARRKLDEVSQDGFTVAVHILIENGTLQTHAAIFPVEGQTAVALQSGPVITGGAEADFLQVSMGCEHQIVFQRSLTASVVDEVNTGIELTGADARIRRQIVLPLRRIAADQAIHMSAAGVECFEMSGRIGAKELHLCLMANNPGRGWAPVLSAIERGLRSSSWKYGSLRLDRHSCRADLQVVTRQVALICRRRCRGRDREKGDGPPGNLLTHQSRMCPGTGGSLRVRLCRIFRLGLHSAACGATNSSKGKRQKRDDTPTENSRHKKVSQLATPSQPVVSGSHYPLLTAECRSPRKHHATIKISLGGVAAGLSR